MPRNAEQPRPDGEGEQKDKKKGVIRRAFNVLFEKPTRKHKPDSSLRSSAPLLPVDDIDIDFVKDFERMGGSKALAKEMYYLYNQSKKNKNPHIE